MNILGNSNCIMHIISNMLKMQNPKLMDHGSRVGYLAAKMLETQGAASKEIIEAYILGLLHDIGAYKTEEIDKDAVYSANVQGDLFTSNENTSILKDETKITPDGTAYKEVPLIHTNVLDDIPIFNNEESYVESKRKISEKKVKEKYDVKLESPWFVADYLINSIGTAPNSTLGNKCSPFLHFYRDKNDIMLSAALEEKKLGLRPEEWHYSLYITDNNGNIGEYYSTNSLSEDELANLLKDIFTEIENRLYFRMKHLSEKSVFSKLGLLLPGEKMVCNSNEKVMTFNTLPEGCVWMRKHGYKEKDIEKVKPIFTIGTCFHCGDYLFPSFSDNYDCQCFTCEEDFFECEQNELQKREDV